MTWDEYFYEMCLVVAKKSMCLSRKIGSVLVFDKTPISTGYNGPPRGVPHCDERYKIDKELRATLESKGIAPDRKSVQKVCPRYTMGFKSGQGLEWCIAGHSERNALINAARLGISTRGTTLYMSCGIPCTPCLVEIINAGVSEIVVTKIEFYDQSSRYLLENSNLEFRVYEHLK
jgi:dCMP deaminase